jgi:hypothetical protein
MMPSSCTEPVESMMDLVASVRRRGVHLWAEQGALRYRAPPGALSPQDKARLAAASVKIAMLLDQSSVQPALQRRAPSDRVPLTVPQLVHWHVNHLRERTTRRSVTSATRLRGAVDLSLLRASVDTTVRRHEALRTRIRVSEGVPIQQVDERLGYQFEIVDLTGVSEDLRDAHLEQIIQDLILQPVHVSEGPMFGVRVVQLRPNELVLVAAMEHSISDAVSNDILLREIFQSYEETSHGRVPHLPEIPIQFADYAVWLSKLKTQPQLINRHRRYWSERLPSQPRLQFPPDGDVDIAGGSPWARVPIRISATLKSQLTEWCRRRRTTLVLAVFTALVALLLRWCGAREGVVAYQIDGRASPLLANTIGYFADNLYLRVQLREHDTFLDLLEYIMEEYCAAHEHALLNPIDEQFAHPELVRGTGLNWIPQQPTSAVARIEASTALMISPVEFSYPLPLDFDADYEPGVVMTDQGSTIEGRVVFPLSRFRVSTMTAFADCLLLFITELIRQPDQRIVAMQLTGHPDSMSTRVAPVVGPPKCGT